MSRYGILEPADRDLEEWCFAVARVLEKPSPGQTTSRYAVMGRYVLGATVLATLAGTPPDASGEVQLADALQTLPARGERVLAVPLLPGEQRHDIGTVAGYASVFLRYALRDRELGPELRRQAQAIIAEHG